MHCLAEVCANTVSRDTLTAGGSTSRLDTPWIEPAHSLKQRKKQRKHKTNRFAVPNSVCLRRRHRHWALPMLRDQAGPPHRQSARSNGKQHLLQKRLIWGFASFGSLRSSLHKETKRAKQCESHGSRGSTSEAPNAKRLRAPQSRARAQSGAPGASWDSSASPCWACWACSWQGWGDWMYLIRLIKAACSKGFVRFQKGCKRHVTRALNFNGTQRGLSKTSRKMHEERGADMRDHAT